MVVAQEFVDVETAKQAGRTAFDEMVAHFREVSDPMDFSSDASLGQLRRAQQEITTMRARAAERKAADALGLPQSGAGYTPP